MGRVRRDTLITFLRAGDVDNGLRSEPGAFAALHQTWASKRDVSDAERIAAAQVEAVVSARFLVRWTVANADVTAKDLILVGAGPDAQHYAITGTKDVGYRSGIELTAHTVQAPT